MKTKHLALPLLSILLAALFLLSAGCTGKNTEASGLDPSNPVTLTLWHYYVSENKQALENAITQFNQTIGIEQGVIIDVVAKGSIAELEKDVTASAMGVINSNPMPDLFSSYPDKALEIDSYDMLCDLNEYFTEDEKNMYVANFLADGVYDNDRLLLIPIAKSTELLYINDTAWSEFSLASGKTDVDLATWEALYDTAKAYYQWIDSQTPDSPWDGKGLIGFDSVANYIIIGNKQMGVDIIDGKGEQAVLNRDSMRRIFDVYYKGIALGYFDAVGKYRSDDIKSSDLVGYVGSSSSAAYFPTWIEKDNTQAPIDFLPLAYPVFSGGESYAIQQGAGMCVAKSTPQKQAGAALFLKWFTSTAQNIEFAMTTGYLPVRKDAYDSPEFNTVLTDLRAGGAAEQNVAGVYEIALHQITQSNTYAFIPFTGSYDVRSTIQSTLMNLAAEAKESCAQEKAQGLSEEEILESLHMDARFEDWLTAIGTQLGQMEINYSE